MGARMAQKIMLDKMPLARQDRHRNPQPKELYMEKTLGKLEAKVDEWIAKFEAEPISTGVKVVLVVLLLRFIWRSFK